MYGNEGEVGEAIAASNVPRSEVCVVSKLKPDDMGFDATLRACQESCRLMGLAHIDVYLIHAPGGSRQKRLDTWRAMEQLFSEGKCRAIGVSNFQERHLREILSESSLKIRPMVNQWYAVVLSMRRGWLV